MRNKLGKQQRLVYRHLQDHGDWFKGCKLKGLATRGGWIGTDGDRRARELFELGYVEKVRRKGYTYFKIKNEHRKKHYEYDAERNVMVEITQ